MGSEISPRTAHLLRDLLRHFPFPGAQELLTLASCWACRPDGEASEALCAGRQLQAAWLFFCVFYRPKISASCSPLIIHRSCFLSPQYLGCFPASPPTGQNPYTSEFPGPLLVNGFSANHNWLWCPVTFFVAPHFCSGT